MYLSCKNPIMVSFNIDQFLTFMILALMQGCPSESAIISNSPVTLQSPRATDFGDWGDFEYCPEGTYVLGMKLKTEPAQGPGDDTALNGISFMCGVIGEHQKVLHSPSRQIQSSSGDWGTWGVSYECVKSYAVGFQLRSEAGQKNHDDTAANNVRIYCADSKSMRYLEGSGLSWGTWTEPQLCPYGWAMCGLRTQVEAARGHKVDDTALNNLDAQCCKLKLSSDSTDNSIM